MLRRSLLFGDESDWQTRESNLVIHRSYQLQRMVASFPIGNEMNENKETMQGNPGENVWVNTGVLG